MFATTIQIPKCFKESDDLEFFCGREIGYDIGIVGDIISFRFSFCSDAKNSRDSTYSKGTGNESVIVAT